MIHIGLAILRQRINQGIKNKRQYIKVPFSKNIVKICRLLQKEGLISSIKYESEYNLIIQLKFYRDLPVFREMVLVSKPSHYVYKKKMKFFNKKLGLNDITFLSTNKGVLTEAKLYSQQLIDYNLKKEKIVNKKTYPFYNSYILDYKDYTKTYSVHINRLFGLTLSKLPWCFLVGFLNRFFIEKKSDRKLNDYITLDGVSLLKFFKRFRLRMSAFYFQKKYMELFFKLRFALLYADKKKKNFFVYKKKKKLTFIHTNSIKTSYFMLEKQLKKKNIKLSMIFQKISYSKYLYFLFKHLIIVKVNPVRELDKRFKQTYRLGTGGKVLFKIKL